MFYFCLFPRHNLDQANEKFKKVLIEMIRGTIAIEELIGQKLNARAKMSEESQGNLTGNKDSQESGLFQKDFFCNFLFIFFKLSTLREIMSYIYN